MIMLYMFELLICDCFLQACGLFHCTLELWTLIFKYVVVSKKHVIYLIVRQRCGTLCDYFLQACDFSQSSIEILTFFFIIINCCQESFEYA